MIAAEIEPADPDGVRRSPRASVAIDANLDRDGLGRTLCKIVDMSLHGVGLQTYSEVRRGSLLWLTLPMVGPRAIKVVRADDFSAGCEFLEPLHPAEFNAIVAIDASLDRKHTQ